MAVCNLINKLSKETGNFIMFSQYIEDLTQSSSKFEAYRIIPSKFVVMDIDYNKVKSKFEELNISSGDLNVDIPKYFQNYFENGCAYLRDNYPDLDSTWSPNISTNLFWKSLYDINMFTTDDDVENTTNITINEVKYVDDINIQSYDVKSGMGYNEIYCHIPSEAKSYLYKIDKIDTDKFPAEENIPNHLQGYPDINIENYSKKYYYDKNFDMHNFENKQLNDISKYSFNTVIVLYDIYIINNQNKWVLYNQYNGVKESIPMGIYFTGKFVDTELTNPVTKYITNEDAFGMGSSYGLRICSRFTVTVDGEIEKNNPIEITTSHDNYSAFCKVMSEISETHTMMNTIISNVIKQSQDIKDTLAIFKNSKINVPYIKEINGEKFWFVNGKCIGAATVIQNVIGDDYDIANYAQTQNTIDKLEILNR